MAGPVVRLLVETDVDALAEPVTDIAVSTDHGTYLRP